MHTTVHTTDQDGSTVTYEEEYAAGHKYSSALAAYIDMNQDKLSADEETSHPWLSEGAARYGRRLLIWSDQGFVSVDRYDTAADAEAVFAEIEADYRGDDDEGDDDEGDDAPDEPTPGGLLDELRQAERILDAGNPSGTNVGSFSDDCTCGHHHRRHAPHAELGAGFGGCRYVNSEGVWCTCDLYEDKRPGIGAVLVFVPTGGCDTPTRIEGGARRAILRAWQAGDISAAGIDGFALWTDGVRGERRRILTPAEVRPF